MKTTIIALILLTTTKVILAQGVSYQLIEDNPEALSENFINLDILGLDYGANGTDGNVYIGGNVFWSISGSIKLEGLLRLTAFNIKGKGLGLQSETGVFFPLIKNKKVKEVPVIMKTTLFAGRDANYNSYDETKYFKVDGTYKNQIGPRGGLYFKKTGFVYEINGLEGEATSMNLGGAYFGLEKISQAYVKTKVGNEFKYGAGQTRMYFDVLLLPLRSVADPMATDLERDNTLGWRIGFQWNQRPHKTREKFETRPVYTAELGKRPYTGLYINISIGIMLFSKP